MSWPWPAAARHSLEVILDQSTVAKALGNMKKRIGAENHSPDKPPIGDVWNYAGCDDNYGMPGFPGRIPGQIVENLLHFYTDVFDLTESRSVREWTSPVYI